MLFLMEVSNVKKLNLLGWQCVIYHKGVVDQFSHQTADPLRLYLP